MKPVYERATPPHHISSSHPAPPRRRCTPPHNAQRGISTGQALRRLPPREEARPNTRKPRRSYKHSVFARTQQRSRPPRLRRCPCTTVHSLVPTVGMQIRCSPASVTLAIRNLGIKRRRTSYPTPKSTHALSVSHFWVIFPEGPKRQPYTCSDSSLGKKPTDISQHTRTLLPLIEARAYTRFVGHCLDSLKLPSDRDHELARLRPISGQLQPVEVALVLHRRACRSVRIDKGTRE